MTEGVPRFGRYELLRRLDRGGMGDVFLARSSGAERVRKLVVLKRIRTERLHDETARSRFIEEARVAVALVHPHIVPVFEFGELDGEHFLVMEWLRGGELARIAGIDRPPLGAAAVALLGSQLCDALAYVHSRTDRRRGKLVHGDVTPRNVLLSPEGHALLSDFGLARFSAKGRAGTARYLAPEQARGESIDGRADLYALALLLCEAATGQPAYDRDPALAAAQSKVGIIPPLDGCNPQLATVLRHALAARPAERFADAAAMRDAFEALLDREPRARSIGRDELVGRVAAAAREDGAGSESRVDQSTIATRGGTRLVRSRRVWLWAAGLLIVGGAAVATRALRPPRPSTVIRLPAQLAPVIVEKAAPAPALAPVRVPAAGGHLPATAPAATAASTRRPLAGAVAPATLDVNATPWAHVRIDGRDRGETPLLGLSLPPGVHQVELINEPLGARRMLTVELRPGEHQRRIEAPLTGTVVRSLRSV